MLRRIGLLMMVMMMGSCGNTVRYQENRGYYIEGLETKIAQLEVGKTSMAKVEELFGSPSVVYEKVEGDGIKYLYINYQMQTYFIKHPEVVDRKMLVFTFDRQQVLTDFSGVVPANYPVSNGDK